MLRRFSFTTILRFEVLLMLKRMAGLAAAGLLMLSLTACGGQVEQLETLEPASSGIQQTAVSPEKFDDTLDGLCEYMLANQAVTGEKVEMSYKEIGAVGGYRYRFKFNSSTLQVEFYEFDLDNPDEKARECLDSVKEKGFFTLLGNDVPASLNGRYMMIYTDASNDELNTTKRDEVLELFNSFYP